MSINKQDTKKSTYLGYTPNKNSSKFPKIPSNDSEIRFTTVPKNFLKQFQNFIEFFSKFPFKRPDLY